MRRVRTLQAEAADSAESACDRAEELADLTLDWPAEAALPDAAQAYKAVKVADVVDAWQRYDVPERRFEARLTPPIEIGQVKRIAQPANWRPWPPAWVRARSSAGASASAGA